ncbi:unnamed protein product [Urochloa humidicola]
MKIPGKQPGRFNDAGVGSASRSRSSIAIEAGAWDARAGGEETEAGKTQFEKKNGIRVESSHGVAVTDQLNCARVDAVARRGQLHLKQQGAAAGVVVAESIIVPAASITPATGYCPYGESDGSEARHTHER